MRSFSSSAAKRLAGAWLIVLFAGTDVGAQTMRSVPRPSATSTSMEERQLFLEVVINGTSTGVIVALKEGPAGKLIATAKDLSAAGLKPDKRARRADGRIDLEKLPGVSYRVDESAQVLLVETSDAARVTRIVDARHKPRGDRPEPRLDYGAVLNYSLFGATGALDDLDFGHLDTFSGSFDLRAFGPYGTVTNSFIAGRAGDWRDDVIRLRTSWAYSDPLRMITYRAGDIVSGGLTWTRSVNLGGAQVQRNFQLRSDLVTKPLPTFAGSAAVPSTIEVYTQNTRTWSGRVAPGPFEVVNLPVIGPSGEARVILRDSQGRETVTSVPFYASDRLLREGLLDFSIEAGFPRRSIGVESADYDDSPFAVLSARYGFSNKLTLEGHAELGSELANGGMGAVFLLGRYGTASIAAAGSAHDDRVGALANATLTLKWGDWSFYGRTQRSFGDYDDVASVNARALLDARFESGTMASVPQAIDQLSVGVPVPLKNAYLQLSYARVKHDAWRDSEVVGVNYGHEIWPRVTLRASLFQNLTGSQNLGLYAGMTIALDYGLSVSGGYDHRADGARATFDVMKSESPEVGGYGWRARVQESDDPVRSASASYRSSIARFETTVTQYGNDVRGTASAEGALAFAGGGVFATQRIYDAFAVVDVGAPNVEVSAHNRVVGITDSWGRILVPNLHSYEINSISIDPSNLPVDAQVPATKEIVVPAGGGGVVVDFGVQEQSHSALVTFTDPSGKPLRAGSVVRLDGHDREFVVGYGGEAFLESLALRNVATIEGADGKACRAEFSYSPAPGTQVRINEVVCR